MSNYKYYYDLVDIKLCVNMPYKIKIKEESKEFIVNEIKEDIVVDFIAIDKPIFMEDDILYNGIIIVQKTKYGLVYSIRIQPGAEPHEWFIPIKENHYEVRYLKEKESYIEYSRNLLEIINIEQILNNFNAFILHSSFINWNNKGILFSAPSGTGKSTQADLWEKYENAEIINGDKAGIRKMDGRWMAYGLPFAGTSGIYKNKKAEISHIIVLKQGKENKLTKLSPREAFVKLYSETLVHTWDKEFQENIINMITDVVQNVQIYQYECLPDKSAVDFLKEQIIKDRGLFIENDEQSKFVK